MDTASKKQHAEILAHHLIVVLDVEDLIFAAEKADEASLTVPWRIEDAEHFAEDLVDSLFANQEFRDQVIARIRTYLVQCITG